MIKKLLNLNLKFTKNQKGLTLIELLIVIVILGIIAAIAIPAISSQRDKAKENSDAQTESVLLDAAKRYQAIKGDWPSDSMTELVPEYVDSIPVPATCGGGTFVFNEPTGASGEGETATAAKPAEVVTDCN